MPNDTELDTEISNATGDPAYEELFQSAGALAEDLVKDDTDEADPFVEAAAEPKAGDEPAAPVEGEEAEPVEQTDEDRLAALDPVNYVVDGQSKDFPGVRIFKDAEGNPTGFIGKIADLPTLQARLSKADYYEANFAGAVEKAAAARLNTMEFTTGAGDAKQVHRGAQAFDAAQLENARLSAAVKVFATTIEDPNALIELAYAVQQAVTAGQPAMSVPEMARLQRDLGYALKDAVWNHRETKGRVATEQQQTASAETQRATITTNEISKAVETWGKRYPGLTQEDSQNAITYLTKLGSAIVRPPSPEEQRKFGLAAGSFVTDHPVIDGYLANLHKARVAANASAKTTDAVTAENARRQAAVNAGKPSNSKKPVTKTRVTVPPTDTKPTWEQIKESWSMGVPLDVSGSAE